MFSDTDSIPVDSMVGFLYGYSLWGFHSQRKATLAFTSLLANSFFTLIPPCVICYKGYVPKLEEYY